MKLPLVILFRFLFFVLVEIVAVGPTMAEHVRLVLGQIVALLISATLKRELAGKLFRGRPRPHTNVACLFPAKQKFIVINLVEAMGNSSYHTCVQPSFSQIHKRKCSGRTFSS